MVGETMRQAAGVAPGGHLCHPSLGPARGLQAAPGTAAPVPRPSSVEATGHDCLELIRESSDALQNTVANEAGRLIFRLQELQRTMEGPETTINKREALLTEEKTGT